MNELCIAFSLNISNGGTLDDASEARTWRSSFRNLRRIDYITYSRVLISFDVSANSELDLVSDPRCAHSKDGSLFVMKLVSLMNITLTLKN